jgi:hypothetical protein
MPTSSTFKKLNEEEKLPVKNPNQSRNKKQISFDPNSI